MCSGHGQRRDILSATLFFTLTVAQRRAVMNSEMQLLIRILQFFEDSKMTAKTR